jgi:transposase
MRAQKFEEELRLKRIKKYGKQSEKLSDYQLLLLDLEPAVSSEEVTAERHHSITTSSRGH